MRRANVKKRRRKEQLELEIELDRCEYGFIVKEEDWVIRERLSVMDVFCGFKIIRENHNQLWLWKTLESV